MIDCAECGRNGPAACRVHGRKVGSGEAADENEVITQAIGVASNLAATDHELLRALICTNAVIASRLGQLRDIVAQRLPGDL